MAVLVDCPACAAGNHEQHDAKWGIREGLIGGQACACSGDCGERAAEATAALVEALGIATVPQESVRHRALALLTGARESHTLSAPVCDLIATALRRHPDECTRTGRHLLGLAECEMYRRALVVLGIGGAA